MTTPPQLTPEMIEELDEFLLSDGAPPDSMGISDLDGLLTGIVVGPELIMPSEWIPVIWQGGEPTFADAQQAERIMSIIMARYNEIIRELDSEPDEFRPILWQASDGRYLAADWCEGFMDAVELRVDAWQPLLEADAMIIAPIMAHLHDSDGEPLLDGTPEELDEIRKDCTEILPHTVQGIHDFWKLRRSPGPEAPKPAKRDTGDLDFDGIITDLARSEELPREIITACLNGWEKAAPPFVDLLRQAADGATLTEDEVSALFYLVHMFAEKNETSACAPLLKFVSRGKEIVEAVLGDAVTENLHKIIISVFDGNADLLYGLMSDPDADPFCRDAAFRAWSYQVAIGRVDRVEAERYLTSCYEDLKPRGENYIWVSWCDAVAVVGVEDLSTKVWEIFDKGWIPDRALVFEDYEDRLRSFVRVDDPIRALIDHRLEPFTDTIGTLSKWHGFSDEYIQDKRQWERDQEQSVTVTNPFRNVGRNDPCPCGSGKKFKVCCGAH
jgi:uncharacterized protein